MLVGRTGLSPVMVGRSAELDRLTRLLAAPAAPEIALIGGEAGIGKTRLVQELVARVPAGTLIISGQADPGSLGRPLELLLDAISGIQGVDQDLLEVVADGSRRSDERVDAGVQLIRTLAGGRRAVTVFEDLHWADSESVTLFERLADPDGGPMLLVGTYRPDHLTRRHPAGELVPRLERRHSVTHLRLDRLSPSDVSTLLGAIYGDSPSFRVVDALHSRTGGNPFFLEELLTQADSADLARLANQPLPWTLAEVIRAQLDELEPEERRVAEAAAVLGRKIPFDLLAVVTRSTEDDLISLLRSLVDKGLMVETESDVFTFRHALAREAIESALLGRERRQLHRAALDALREGVGTGDDHPRDSYGDYAAMARHAHGAGQYDDMVAAAREGARRYLALGSSYQGLELAELALSEAGDDCQLLALASRATWLIGLVGDSVALCERWLVACREAGDAAGECAARRLRVRLAYEAGEIALMERLVAELEASLDDHPNEEEKARTMHALAQSYMLLERTDEACRWADAAYELGRELGLREVVVGARVEKGSALTMTADRSQEGGELLLEAAEEAADLGEHVLAARAFNNAIWHTRSRIDVAEVRHWAERARDQAERGGFAAHAGAAHALSMSFLAAYEGDLSEARRWLEEGRRKDRGAIGSGKGLSYPLTQAGFALEAGDFEAAARFAAESNPPVEKTRIGVFGLNVHLASRLGDLETARAELGSLLGALDAARKLHQLDASTAHDIIAAGLRGGLTAPELRPLLEYAGGPRLEPLSPGDPWRQMLEAQLAEADGDTDAAYKGYAAAAAGFFDNFDSWPAQRGTAHVGTARTLIGLGHADEATPHAITGRELLGRWGGWRVEELEAVERRLRLGEPVAGPEALTPREREVVALLAEGLTNAELAERLFISPKTAAVHVSNILAKLGMASRTEVATFAVREGLAATT